MWVFCGRLSRNNGNFNEKKKQNEVKSKENDLKKKKLREWNLDFDYHISFNALMIDKPLQFCHNFVSNVS